MENKKISLALFLAGAAALVGVAALFFGYAPLLADECRAMYPEFAHLFWPGLAYLWIIAALYLLALGAYFLVIRRVARNNIFCPENVRGLFRMAWFMAGAGGLWLIGIFLPGLAGAPIGPAFLLLLLAAMASAALSALAWGLGRLLRRAVALKEENDLTV